MSGADELPMAPEESAVWILWHLPPGGDPDDGMLIGAYASEASALALKRLGDKPGFRDHPEVTDDASKPGFFLERYELDKDHWTDGYRTERAGDETYTLPAWLPPDVGSET